MSRRNKFSSLAQLLSLVIAVDGSATGSYLSGDFHLHPACQSEYNAVCSIGNTALTVSRLAEALNKSADTAGIFANVNAGKYNAEDGFGFEPVVYDMDGRCVADSGDNTNVGETLSSIEASLVPSVQQDGLFDKFKTTAATGGWASFVWAARTDYKGMQAKLSNPEPRIGFFQRAGSYIVGASYTDVRSPQDQYCAAGKNDGCSVTNCRSLVGDGLSKIMMSPNPEALNEVFRKITRDRNFKVYRPDGTYTGFYVFVYKFGFSDKGMDTYGVNIAHGANADFVGKNLTEILKFVGNTGVNGEELHSLFVTAAENGGGWADYYWANSPGAPATPKIAFIAGAKKFGVKYYLGVGFNNIPKPVAAGGHCTACSAGASSPCSIQNTFSLISHTQAELLKETTDQHILFSKISLGGNFKIPGGFYVFMYDFNSTCVVHGANVKNVGKTLPGIIAGAGLPVDGEKLHSDFKAAAISGGGWVRYTWRNKGESSDYTKVAYLIKVSKFGKFYYAGVGYTNKAVPPQPNVSAHYSSAAVVDNLLSVIGLAQAEINNALDSTELRSAFDSITNSTPYAFSTDESGKVSYTPSLSYKISDGCFVQVLDRNGIIVADGQDRNLVGKTLDEAAIMKGWELFSGAVFFAELRSHADRDAGSTGGSWFQFQYKAAGKASPLEKAAYVTKAYYNPPVTSSTDGGYIKDEYYIWSSHGNRPMPEICGHCPEHSSCMPPAQGETIAFCACHPQYEAVFEKVIGTAQGACDDGFDFQHDSKMTCASSGRINYNHLSSSILTVTRAAVGIVYAVALFLLVWIRINRDHPVVNSSQPFFLYLIITGCVCSTSSVFLMGVDDNGIAPTVRDGVYSWPTVDQACEASPWLYCLGFGLTFSSLCAKTKSAIKSNKRKFVSDNVMKVRVSRMDVAIWIGGCLLFQGILLLVWNVTDPLRWVRMVTKMDEDGGELASYAHCTADNPWPYLGALLGFQVLLLIYGNVLAYKARDVPGFVESKWIAIGMLNSVQSMVIGIPVLYMVRDQPELNFIMKFSIIMSTDMGILLLIFMPKIYHFYQARDTSDEDVCSNEPNVFICHHKHGAGGFARLIKLELQKRGVTDIFLDSDNLVDLHSVVPVVGRSKHLLVLVSKELIFRPWCLCEIHTALTRAIPLTLVNVGFAVDNSSQKDDKTSKTDRWLGRHGTRSLPTTEEFQDYVKYLFTQDRFRKIFEDHQISLESLLDLHDCLTKMPMVDMNTGSHLWNQSCDHLLSLVSPELSQKGLRCSMKISKRQTTATKCIGVYDKGYTAMGRVISVMLPKLDPGLHLMIQEDTLQSNDEHEQLVAEQKAVAESDGVVIILTKGLFRSTSAMIKLCRAIESAKMIIPIMLDPADSDEIFVFPDDTWYLRTLPSLYKEHAGTYKAHHIPLDNLADAIQAMVMKLAVRFTENESGHAQRASVRTLVERYMSKGRNRRPAGHEQATAGVMISRRHEAQNNQVMPVNDDPLVS